MPAHTFSRCSRTVAHMQLLNDGLHMPPSCGLSNMQLLADFPIGEAFADQAEHLCLPLRQLGVVMGQLLTQHERRHRIDKAEATDHRLKR